MIRIRKGSWGCLLKCKLKELGLRGISLGIGSGDDWTLERINKGSRAGAFDKSVRNL
jgi:hypothetical protein